MAALGNGNHSLGNDNQLQQIARSARIKKRIPSQEMRKILLDLCDGRWLSRTHLAQIVKRNPEDLRNRYINPMVSEGVLQLLYPATINRTVSINNIDSDDE